MSTDTPMVIALKEEIAGLSECAAEAWQSRAHWRARAKVAESELAKFVDDLDTERLAHREAADELAKARTDLQDNEEECKTLRAQLEERAEEVSRLVELAATRARLLQESDDKLALLAAQKASAEAKKPVTFDEQGVRFELHRILTQGGTRAEVLGRVKALRDRFGGDPSGEPGWTP